VSELEQSRVLRGEAVLADELVGELLDARLIGVLATFDSARVIHAIPMWYASDDGAVLLATSSRSRKVTNLERDPTATLVLHDSRPGYEVCGASIVGSIDIIRAPAARELIDRVHARYVVTEAATGDPTALSFLESDDIALRFRPVSAFTWDHRASEGSRILRRHGWALPLVTTAPRA
jgi:hypothetical protein